MDAVLATAGALAATIFTLDLVRDLRRGIRPHVAAYAVGIGMFAIATWALAIALLGSWTGATYRTFFLFGAILNIPFLALGSMFLVVGKRSGHVMTVLLGAFSAISVTLTTTVPFERALPADGIPSDMFPPISDGFGPRLLAAIGGGTGATLLILLAVVSIFRFWRANPRIVVGNLFIVAGTFVASWQGTGLALGRAAGFAISLFVTSVFLWAGYRITRGARATTDGDAPLVVLVGPSVESPERAHTELLISRLEQRGFDVVCPARDIENWGDIGFTPTDTMEQTFDVIEKADVVLVDLHQGYGVVAAGYARALRVPIVVASPEGQRIPRPMRGVALVEIYYTTVDDVVDRLTDVVTPGRPPQHATP